MSSSLTLRLNQRWGRYRLCYLDGLCMQRTRRVNIGDEASQNVCPGNRDMLVSAVVHVIWCSHCKCKYALEDCCMQDKNRFWYTWLNGVQLFAQCRSDCTKSVEVLASFRVCTSFQHHNHMYNVHEECCILATVTQTLQTNRGSCIQQRGAAGVHLEDQKPGTKKCGHMVSSFISTVVTRWQSWRATTYCMSISIATFTVSTEEVEYAQQHDLLVMWMAYCPDGWSSARVIWSGLVIWFNVQYSLVSVLS